MKGREGLFLFAIILLFLMVTLLSCAKKSMWYKKGASQWDFNRDEQECLAIAHRLARQDTVGERRENFLVFIQAYQNCLYSKGWSPISPYEKKMLTSPLRIPYKLDMASHAVYVFGKRIALPSHVVYMRASKRIYGPTIICSLFFRKGRATYLNLIFQKSLERAFKKIPFPVPSNYVVYDRGRISSRDIEWASYFGKVRGYMIMGFGAMVRLSYYQRIILIITSPLPSPLQTPPPFLHLAKNQMEAIESFTSRWKKWIFHVFSSERKKEGPFFFLKGLP